MQNGVRIEQNQLELGGELVDCQSPGQLPEDTCNEPLSMWGDTEGKA